MLQLLISLFTTEGISTLNMSMFLIFFEAKEYSPISSLLLLVITTKLALIFIHRA